MSWAAFPALKGKNAPRSNWSGRAQRLTREAQQEKRLRHCWSASALHGYGILGSWPQFLWSRQMSTSERLTSGCVLITNTPGFAL